MSCRHSSYVDPWPKFMPDGSFCVDRSPFSVDADGNQVTQEVLNACESWSRTDISGQSFTGFNESGSTCTSTYRVWYDRNQAEWCTHGGCVKGIAANPLDMVKPHTDDWAIVPMSDFNGKFEAKGVVTKGGAKIAPRKKPTLVEFGSTQPEYAEECKDESTPGATGFDVNTMNKVGLGLTDPSNPCKAIAGSWVNGEKQGNAYTAYSGNSDPNAQLPSMNWWLGGGGAASKGYEGPVAGTTYESIDSCFNRAFKKTQMNLHAKDFHEFAKWGITEAEGLIEPLCGFMPSFVMAPLGGGIGGKPPEAACETAIAAGATALQWVNTKYEIVGAYAHNKGEQGDCGKEQESMKRIFCDLHCIRDTVKAGTKAILTSLEKAISKTLNNLDLLMEYYSGTTNDMLEVMKATQKANEKKQDKFRQNSIKTKFLQMFLEIKGLLKANLHAEGRATAKRALDMFTTRLPSPDAMGFKNSTDNSALIADLHSEVSNLMDTIRIASSRQLSTAGAVAQKTQSALQGMTMVLQQRNQMLGVYHASAVRGKKDQAQLLKARDVLISQLEAAVVLAAKDSLLIDFERSWWAIREKLDAYLETAESQSTAWVEAMTVINHYTSKCDATFANLNEAQAKVVRADEEAKKQLHDTWHSVVHELGSLVARIADTQALIQLSRWDVGAAELDRVAVCSKGSSSKQAALSAVRKSLVGGLAEQTWKQLEGIFVELPLLYDSFSALNMPEPSKETWDQAEKRAIASLEQAQRQQGELAVELASHLCTSDHPLVEIHAVSTSSPLDNEKKFEGYVQAQHVAEKKLEMFEEKLEAQHAADVKMTEAQHSADDKKITALVVSVGVLVVVVLVTLGWSMWRK